MDEEDPGVPVLSRFAGAAQQPPQAVIVNPEDKSEVADAFRDALNMGLGRTHQPLASDDGDDQPLRRALVVLHRPARTDRRDHGSEGRAAAIVQSVTAPNFPAR